MPCVLALATLAARLAVVGGVPTEWDSVQLALGLDRFDVRQESPHAPGYYLYVVAGRVVRALTPLDANHSLVVVAALASAALVAVVYLIGRRLGGGWLGGAAAVLVATSPFFWIPGGPVAVRFRPGTALFGLPILEGTS